MSCVSRLLTRTRLRVLRIQSSESFRATTSRKLSTFHHQLLDRRPAIMPTGIKPFNESVTSVRITDEPLAEGEEEGVFFCDEEPHILKPEQGFGFNPLKLGDHLQGTELHNRTYEVVRKLGYGGNSSVWLVKYNNKATNKDHFLALKVLTVNVTAGIVNHQYWELDSALLITRANPEHPGYHHCLMLRDSFVCESYHGPHMSLAFDVMGSGMHSLQATQSNHAFSSHVTKRIIKQVLLALDYLHKDCHLVHRDVKPQNIMVSLDVSDETITEYLDKNPAARYEPQIEPSLSPDPIITFKSQRLPNFGLHPSLDNLVVKLADYGETISISKIDVEDECQPVLLRAPEIVLGHPWSTPIDIWSVGCMVFEFLTGAPMFKLYESPTTTVADSHLQRMTEHIGKIPSTFLANCSKRAQYFDENGELLRVKTLFPQTIEQALATYKHVRSEDIAPAAAFIRRCLTFDPSARPSASELLQDEWLKLA